VKAVSYLTLECETQKLNPPRDEVAPNYARSHLIEELCIFVLSVVAGFNNI
jgi:hypothetical protein